VLVLEHYLKIGNKIFPGVNDVVIESTRESISDICTIDLPKYRKLQPSDVKQGDVVIFRAGYRQYGLQDEFHGVVSEVTPTQPLTVKAEDYFYYLRDIVSTTYKKMYAGDIVKQLCQGTSIDTSRVQQGIFITYKPYQNVSKRFIVQDLAKRCGFDAHMLGKYLIFNKPFADMGSKIPVFKYGLNIIDERLTFRTDCDYDRVVVISEQTDGSGKIFKGVAGSGKKTLTVYLDNLGKDTAIERAKEIYDEISYMGFTGDFTTFGYPSVHHSSVIKVEDERFPQKNGNYQVDKLTKKYGGGGYRQEITLGKKVA